MKYEDIPIIKLNITILTNHLTEAQDHLQDAVDESSWSTEITSPLLDMIKGIDKIKSKLQQVNQELDKQVDDLFKELMP